MTKIKAQHIVTHNQRKTETPQHPEQVDRVYEVAKNSAFVVTSDKVEINWFHTGLLTIIPALMIYGLFTVKITLPTVILSFIMYFWTGLGITGGYHRLWSHRAFQARWFVRLMLCLGGGGAFEGSAKWWCRNHRAHHRYTDTERDPYNAKRGFFYAHLGWMLVKQKAKCIGYADISDLNRDPMILWQHKYYPQVALGVGVVLPVVIASFWGDIAGGFFYACMARIFFVHHATFFVNSLAHTLGDKTYSDLHTAFDSFITALLTLGEGYHNYHHEFPQDYRNGILPYHYDPTKWLISGLSFFGLTYNLKAISDEEIEKAKLQMTQRNLNVELAKLHLGKKFEDIPFLSWEEFEIRTKKGEQLIVINDVVHDVSSFVHDHPGGRQTLLNHVGTDATSFFEGRNENQAHKHSKDALKYLLAMRVAKLKLHY